MSVLTVHVWDATGNKKQVVEMPDDAPVNRLLAVLVEKMNFPRFAPDGQPLSYKLHHRRSGKQLLETQCLRDLQVENDDVLRLQPEITAGASVACEPKMSTASDRFDRFRLIEWWDQRKLQQAKVLVIGAGALGNEILKNLALLGVGNVFVADMDAVEHSNLSRSVLFRGGDDGSPKAATAARAMRGIYPDANVQSFEGNVVFHLGLGAFRWADLIIAGLDNREARLAINRYCWKLGKTWIDGAIEKIQGVARVFVPDGPCYECTMTDADWKILQQRRSCNLLARDEMEAGRTPTTPTISSIIAGLQCQEAVKYLHGLPTIAGRGWVFDGLSAEGYQVEYQRKADCFSHDCLASVIELDASAKTVTISQLLDIARENLGGDAELEFAREIVSSLICPKCGGKQDVYRALGSVPAREAWCPSCADVRRDVQTFYKVRGDEPFLSLTAAQVGIPAFDIVIARSRERSVGLELSGDGPQVLGSLFQGKALEWS